MKTCACYDEFGGEITTTRKTVSRSEAEPICEKPSPAEAQLFLDTQVVNNVGLIASTATTVTLDEHGFSAEQLSIKSKANNLPPCEAELQRTFGRRPKCDESGDYYPVQCSRNTVQSYYTKCWCVNIQTGEITLGSEHNVLSTTIVSSEDAVGEPNLDHGKHCRIGFGTLVQEREQILSNRISDDKTQFHWVTIYYYCTTLASIIIFRLNGKPILGISQFLLQQYINQFLLQRYINQFQLQQSLSQFLLLGRMFLQLDRMRQYIIQEVTMYMVILDHDILDIQKLLIPRIRGYQTGGKCLDKCRILFFYCIYHMQ